MEKLISMNGKPCVCGKVHSFCAEVVTGKGVIQKIPALVRKYGGSKVYVLSDRNTYRAAGKQVCGLLQENGIAFLNYTFDKEELEPNEENVGSAVMHFTMDCNLIIAVGSGVINDIAKILSGVSRCPYMIVATAPSMDGYASATSSMTRDGLKISLNSRCPDVILGDTDILCQAPLKLMKSGLGDMLAKYVSICEWRLANLITGEYYCPEIADLVRQALRRCVENAPGLLNREEKAVEAVFSGLVITGVAMSYAGMSRPASGGEHYISHVIDMRAVEFGTPMDYHGIQCAIGTLISVKLYEKLKTLTPNKEKAMSYVNQFDKEAWFEQLRQFLGRAAESMIALDAKEQKYDKASHSARLERILDNWQQILRIMEEELPTAAQLEQLLNTIQAPKTLGEIGVEEDLLPMILSAAKDMRDKYVLPRLLWDLGILDEIWEEEK